MVNTSETVSAQFQSSAAEVETIFESYRELHEIYTTAFGNLESKLGKLPVQYKNEVLKAKQLFSSIRGTVSGRQTNISDRLYAQGLVLLVGNAETLTRELFKTLLIQNIRTLKFQRDILIPLSRLLEAGDDASLGELVFSVLEEDKNPAEKLNFQNMKQLQGVMKNYLGIEVPDDYIKDLHEFWQIRHIVIHNSGVIDQRFIDNLKSAGIPTLKYRLNVKVNVKKAEYDRCFALLVLLFEALDQEIERLKLEYNAV